MPKTPSHKELLSALKEVVGETENFVWITENQEEALSLGLGESSEAKKTQEKAIQKMKDLFRNLPITDWRT